jgi:hypothetical protein
MGRPYTGIVCKPVGYYPGYGEGDYSTPEHPYYSGGKWKPIGEIEKDCLNGILAIKKFRLLRRLLRLPLFFTENVYLEKNYYAGLVYNLEVDVCHSYIVAGYVVHNCDCELRPRLKSDAELRETFRQLVGE